jgi:hypothetical protein
LDKKENNMKTAVVCIAKYEDYYLDEWLEYNHKLGFDHIFIYENDWRCSIEKDYITKIPFDGNIQQLNAYNHFVQNNKEYDWAAFIDCDEFITLKKHNNIQDFINNYNNPNGIALNWYFFGSGDKIKREENSLLKQFIYRSSVVDQHIKVIMNLRTSFTMTLPHNANIYSIDTNGRKINGPFNSNGPTDVAYINHYRNKTFEDWELRCKRGRADCNLVAKINEWELEKNSNIETLDTHARDFLYNNQSI